jgi:DNA-binding PadR family transcriptional regulator
MNYADGDLIVLGFILLRPMTGYEVKTMMDSTVGHFYRPSFGGIYPSLKKLEREGCVAVEESTGGRKIRKTYRPLPAGRKVFRAWLKKPPDVTKGPGHILAKIFFLGLGGRGAARSLAGEVRRSARERRDWLKRAAEEIRGRADAYQASTCQFGIDYYDFLEKWFARWGEKI